MKLPYKVIVFSSISYLAILALSYFYGQAFFSLPKSYITTSSISLSQANYSSPLIIILQITELAIMFMLVIVELKYKIFSNLLNRLLNFFTKSLATKLIGIALLALIDIGLLSMSVAYGILFVLFFVLIYVFNKIKTNGLLVAFIFMSISMNAFLALEIRTYSLLLIIPIILGMLTLLRKNIKAFNNILATYMTIMYSLVLGITLTPLIPIGFLIVASIYDYFSVFVFRTMQKLGQSAMKNRVPALYMFGDSEQLNKRMEQIVKGEKPEKGQKLNAMLLGSGDIIIPSLCISSFAFFGSQVLFNRATGIELSLLATIGSIAGLALDIWLVGIKGKFRDTGLPCLPIICAFMLGALAVGAWLL